VLEGEGMFRCKKCNSVCFFRMSLLEKKELLLKNLCFRCILKELILIREENKKHEASHKGEHQ